MRSVYQATTTVPSLNNVSLVLVLETARHPGKTLSLTCVLYKSDVSCIMLITKFRDSANISDSITRLIIKGIKLVIKLNRLTPLLPSSQRCEEVNGEKVCTTCEVGYSGTLCDQ